MHLVIDLGNTYVKYAVFHQNEIIDSGHKVKRLSYQLAKGLCEQYPISRGILSHTSEPQQKLLEVLTALDFFINFNEIEHLPINIDYSTPDTLGRDRIAAAVGCFVLFPYQDAIFIDMGTCITKNFINSKGVFLGGNISPGISMRAKAMNKFTARLPWVELNIPPSDIGKNTIEALQNGAIRGAVDEIERFIEKKKTEIGRINVILTGGDRHFFEILSNIKIFAAPYLVLTGLNEILNYNVDKK